MMLGEWGYGNFGTDRYPWNPNTCCFVPTKGEILANLIPQVAAVVRNLST
jgi:hypothetical protein